MSETSTPYTPASTSTTVAGNETVSLADEIKKYKTEPLIEYLRKEEDLGLDDDDLEIFRKQKIMGRDFLKTTKEEFLSYGMPGGPAKRLADFAKECKEKKLRVFSTYRSLKEVLAKYGIGSDGTETIPLFSPQTHEVQDSNKHFEHCIENILFRMKNYGSLVLDSLESMRNEYVSTILHSALHIAGDVVSKEFSMRPEYEIIGDESCGRVDHAIKEAENLICVTEDKRIIELEAENAEIPELRKKLAEIPELRKKLAEVEARNVEIEARNAELLKQMIEENNRRDARIEKLEEKQLQNDNTPNNNFTLAPSANSGAEHHEKSQEDKEVVAFLVDVNKKSIGGDIRRHNKEKKLQRESTVTSDTVYASETVSNDEESDEPEINNITNCIHSESSHGIELVAPQSVNVDVSQDIKVVSENSELSRDSKIVNTVHCFSENSNLSQDSSDRLLGLEGGASTMDAVNGQTYSTGDPSSKIVTEFVQGLLEELLSSDIRLLEHIKFSPPKTIVPGSISIKRLANSFCQANGARNKSIMAKQSEISLWWCYSEKFEDKVVELRSGNKKLTDKTTRSQIYAEMKPYLMGISDGYLRKITSKARKINKLFGYEYDPVTLQKIKEQVKSKTITSSVNEISEPVATTSAHYSNSGDNFRDTSDDTDYFKSDNESDSDANNSDSDVYFKSDDSDTDDEYDHELHERLQHEEMVRLAKLEEKTPTKPVDEEDDFDKILSEAIEEELANFDDPVRLLSKPPTISPLSA
ncbi:hypothetical protein GLOIN_2v1695250 [Rhizophagus clarus]|uniref:Uncharacterized protein n=1 Tax=Rhizophagus clarus TaxID=94130 RepID=A0A8H3LVM1_9GLOM|nr:hypothetical protein GLOIN_2v1695250 [Rhizophagus clarus]